MQRLLAKTRVYDFETDCSRKSQHVRFALCHSLKIHYIFDADQQVQFFVRNYYLDLTETYNQYSTTPTRRQLRVQLCSWLGLDRHDCATGTGVQCACDKSVKVSVTNLQKKQYTHCGSQVLGVQHRWSCLLLHTNIHAVSCTFRPVVWQGYWPVHSYVQISHINFIIATGRVYKAQKVTWWHLSQMWPNYREWPTYRRPTYCK